MKLPYYAMNVYVKALRLPFLAGSIVPVVIGSALAFEEGCLSLPFFITCLLGMAGLHLSANMAYDYYDARGSDPINLRLTPFCGGSRVIQDGEIAPRIVLIMALGLFALGIAAGIQLIFLGLVFSRSRPLLIRASKDWNAFRKRGLFEPN